MKKFKKINYENKHNRLGFAVCFMVFYVTLFLTACGKDGTSDSVAITGESIVSNTAQKQGWVYVPEVITVGDERADYERMQPVGDTFCYVSLGGEENSAKNIGRYSLTNRELTTVSMNWPEGGDNWDIGYRFFTQDQGLYITANVYPADSGSMKRYLCRFDSQGNCLFSKDITEHAGNNVSLRGLTVDGEGRLYIFVDNGEILLYTGDGDYHGTVSYSSPESPVPSQIKGICNGADGKVFICIGQKKENIAGASDDKNARCILMEIDFENARLLEIAANLPDINGFCAGKQSESSDDRYDFLLYDDRAVYGYCFDTQKSDLGPVGEELFIWMDNDINGYCVTNLYLLEDGRLCATVADWMNDDRAIVVLERVKAEQAPQREELVLVTVNGGSDLATVAVKFNRGNSRYHLTVKNYESLTDLYNAVLTKEPMDLIDLSGIHVQELASQGLFEDLTPYVAQSELFDRSDFVDGIMDVYTFDDILVGIPAEFMIRTVVGNREQLDNKTGLTLKELFAVKDRYPGAKAFDGVTKEEMTQYLMMFNKDVFIDWDTGICRFDSEEFKAILEYVSQFPDSAVIGPDEESLFDRIQNGEVLFAVAELYPPYIFRDYVKIFGENAACVGFPTEDGRGGHLLISSDAYAIAAVSEHKEGAWSFIEESLTQEKKNELYSGFYISYPSFKKTLNERVDTAVERGDLNRDDVNVVLDLLPDAMPFFDAKDDQIIKIICEEAPAYYSGQKGADAVTDIIQNRIQLYVNENK